MVLWAIHNTQYTVYSVQLIVLQMVDRIVAFKLRLYVYEEDGERKEKEKKVIKDRERERKDGL